MALTAELDNELIAPEITPKACLPQPEQPTHEPDSDAPATDAHVEGGVAVALPESSAKSEIAELSSSEDSSSGAAESAADEKQTMPQLHNKELAELLDESTGDLVALKDFDGEVDHRAFEPNWFGRHPDHILVAIRAKLLRKGRYTAHIDAAGNLLSDPEEYRLAIALGVQITLCIHREPSADKKLEFILRSQTGNRFCSRKETEELKSHLMLVWIRLGVDYATIAKMANVCPNTVRNVETRAAADTNSKVGFTKRPDGRYKPETREKIAQASRLRAEGKDNSEIAKALDTDPDSVRKWLKDPPAEGTTKNKDKPSKKPKASRGDSEAEPEDMTDAVATVDSVPEVHHQETEYPGQAAPQASAEVATQPRERPETRPMDAPMDRGWQPSKEPTRKSVKLALNQMQKTFKTKSKRRFLQILAAVVRDRLKGTRRAKPEVSDIPEKTQSPNRDLNHQREEVPS